jgi:hypothetical protein
VKIELDHILPRAEGGSDVITNAIAVCFECHAEIHSYNVKHPRGRKFRSDELRQHKEQWIYLCQSKPEIFKEAARDSDVGPLQALIDELEFNLQVAKYATSADLGCLFLDEQFRRATHAGAIATLRDDLKALILEAYRAAIRANQLIPPAFVHPSSTTLHPQLMGVAEEAVFYARPRIEAAWQALVAFLGTESS